MDFSRLMAFRFRLSPLPLVLATLVLADPLTGAAEELPDRNVSLQPDNPVLVDRGRVVYREHCASCHGFNLEGQPNWRSPLENGKLPAPPHDETGHTWHHPDVLLFDLVKRGTAAVVGGGYETDMPGYRDVLSDADIIATLSYIKSQWPEEIRLRHDEMNRRVNE